MSQLNKNYRKKVGLALSSGGLKGFAHIGVIKILEQNHIPIDFIAGSSIGALVGGIYAANKDIKQLEEIVLEADFKKTFGFLDPIVKKGLLKGQKIKQFINQRLAHKDFKDLKIPLAIVATNLKTGEIEVIKDGNLASAIRASISIPVIFQPVRRDEKLLIDGGLTMPIPVNVLKSMGADIVIAVNLYNYPKYLKRHSKIKMAKIGSETTKIMIYQLAKRDLEKAEVIIEPDINIYGLTNLIKYRKKIMRLGEEATQSKISLIKKLIAKN